MLTTSFSMTCPYAKPLQSQGIIHTCVFGVDKVREDGEGAEHDLEKSARQNLHVHHKARLPLMAQILDLTTF